MTETVLEGRFTLGWGVSQVVANDGQIYRVEWTGESHLTAAMRQAGFDAAWTPGYGTAEVRFAGALQVAPGGQGQVFRVHRVEAVGPASATPSPP